MKVARRRDKPVVIPIHGTLRAMLAEIPGSARKEYVLPEMAALYARDSSALCKKIQAHFADNAIQTTRDTGKGRAAMITGYHALRYTFVSMCRELGAPLSVVESIVGHASPAMTRHYTHTSEQAAAAAVNLLPAVLGDTPAPALPPVKMIDAAPIRALAESLTGKNWREVKAEILALT
jgi:integrase